MSLHDFDLFFQLVRDPDIVGVQKRDEIAPRVGYSKVP
jgi:hypothetical protein